MQNKDRIKTIISNISRETAVMPESVTAGTNMLNLFISIMTSAMSNIYPPLFHMINQSLFIINPAAIFPT